MKKILFVRSKKDVNLQSIITNLDLKVFDISILDLKHGELININTNKTLKIIRPIKSRVINYLARYLAALVFMLQFSENYYDVIHVMNIKRENFWLFPFFRNKSSKLLLSVYGRSTFLYRFKRLLFSKVFNFADYIIFTNPELISEFTSYYKNVEVQKIIISYLPMTNVTNSPKKLHNSYINEFCKKYGLRNDLIRISCSSTIASYDQHDKVIDALSKIQNKEKVQLMFLLTYGGTLTEKQTIIKKIGHVLKDFNVVIVDNFLSNEELAVYRHLTDIYVNMRTSDQMAGSVIESLFEGSLLLSASWLNYSILDNIGIYYEKVSNFNQLAGRVDESILSFPKFKSTYALLNREKILNEFSLETTIKRWNDIYLGNNYVKINKNT